MEAIRHRVGVKAPAHTVYDAFATPEGTARWWTRDVRGDAGLGGRIEFRFGGPEAAAVMELVELEPDRRVVWRCDQGPDEWLGTTVAFDIRAGDDDTVVLFTHDGWHEPVEFMHHCSTSWAAYLLSLKQALETGTGAPWPENRRVSTWG